MVEYRYEATGVAGVVQQLAVSYLTNGYRFYVAGRIPSRNDPRAVDRKLIGRYDIAVSKWTRYRRKQAGLANVQYLRLNRFFLLLATAGEHRFFTDEAAVIRDAARGQPIRFAGYSIGIRNGRASVRLARSVIRPLRSELLLLALRLDAAALEQRFAELPYEPYAPVRRQLDGVVRAVNQKRKQAGLSLIDWRCVRRNRRVVTALLPSASASDRARNRAA